MPLKNDFFSSNPPNYDLLDMDESDLRSDAKSSFDLIMAEEEKWAGDSRSVKILKPEFMIENEEEDETITSIMLRPLNSEDNEDVVDEEGAVDEDKEAAALLKKYIDENQMTEAEA